MNQIGKRIKISGSDIYISSPKIIWMLIFLPIWLTGWTVGGILAARQLIIGDMAGGEQLFMIVWLCGWLFGELFASYAFLWGVFGYEVISVQQGVLKIKRSIFDRGPAKDFKLSKITNLRASGLFAPVMSWNFNMAYWGLSGGSVAFDYEGKTKRFGINLNETDANNLADQLKTILNL